MQYAFDTAIILESCQIKGLLINKHGEFRLAHLALH